MKKQINSEITSNANMLGPKGSAILYTRGNTLWRKWSYDEANNNLVYYVENIHDTKLKSGSTRIV